MTDPKTEPAARNIPKIEGSPVTGASNLQRLAGDNGRGLALSSFTARTDGYELTRAADSCDNTQRDGPVAAPLRASVTATALIVENGPTSTPGTAKKARKQNREEYPASFWYEMCEQFAKNPKRYGNSQRSFLRSEDSGMLVLDDRVAFGRRLKAFKEGRLPRDDSIKRNRKGKYEDVERCLLAFLDTRDQFADKGKVAISWPFLLEMSKRFSVALGHDPNGFSASAGWLSKVLKRSKKKIDFEISEEDALFHVESIKKYCRKAKLGNKARSLSVQLHDVVKGSLGKKEEDEESNNDEEVDKHRLNETSHGFRQTLSPSEAASIPTMGARGPSSPPSRTAPGWNINYEQVQPNTANLGFWTSLQQNI